MLLQVPLLKCSSSEVKISTTINFSKKYFQKVFKFLRRFLWISLENFPISTASCQGCLHEQQMQTVFQVFFRDFDNLNSRFDFQNVYVIPRLLYFKFLDSKKGKYQNFSLNLFAYISFTFKKQLPIFFVIPLCLH